MSKSQPATTSSKGGVWSRPRGNTTAWSSSAPSAEAHRMFRKRSSTFAPEQSARSRWPEHGLIKSEPTLAMASPVRCPPASTTPCGKDPRPTARITGTDFTTTGTGSGTGGRASSGIMAFIVSTSPAGAWAWTRPSPCARVAASTSSMTTRRLRIPRRPRGSFPAPVLPTSIGSGRTTAPKAPFSASPFTAIRAR